MLLCSLLAVTSCWALSAEAPVVSWEQAVDAAKVGDIFAEPRAKLIAQAREAAALPIIKRAHSLAEVGQNRTWLDGRSNALEDEIRETFALAMSDHGTNNTLAGELPLLAAAYRLTGENVFRDRVVAQLEEMASWSPLQRPGWTLYHPGARLSKEGKDGNWLATGTGVRALADTLELMPQGSIDAALLARINDLLEKEVTGVVDDWQTKRPWFVRGNNPITNQWVLPTEGLVRACIVLGVDRHRDQYELGVKNLLQALDAHGKNGEFEEGVGYASFTVTSMLHAARAMAAQGDRRAIDHPFLMNFPTWLVHHFQPCDMLVNCFDAGGAKDAANRLRPLLSMLAACTGSPTARWALANLTNGPSDDLAGLVARALPPVGKEAAPPLFAVYERATRVNWRNNWDNDGSGVWVRGGHPLDQHDHHDRGHVNFICRGKPLLIEAGTPYYSHPLMGSHMASGLGHNVLQLGTEEPKAADAGETLEPPGWQPRGVVAPITVHELDKSGGDVTVTISSGYEGLKEWRRDVSWRAKRISVRDSVQLAEAKQSIVLFHWHLGTNDEAIIRGEACAWKVSWPNGTMTLKSGTPIEVTQTRLPDNTINTVVEGHFPDPFHTCVIVQSAEPVSAFILDTKVSGKRN